MTEQRGDRGGRFALSGPSVLVTGATSGLGLAVVSELAALDAVVLLHGPSSDSVEAAVSTVRKSSPDSRIVGVAADLGSQVEVRRLAARVLDETDRLDVLVNNAAAVFDRWHANGDGIELTLAVNYLAPYLLTRLLLQALGKSEEGRIINVASEAHRGATLDLGDLQMTDRYERFDAYRRSKLADLMFTYELARRLEGSSVSVNAAHPGTIRTALFRPRNPIERIVMPMLNLRARPAAKGADTIVWLAASEEVTGRTGGYYVDRAKVASSPESYDGKAARKLWEMSAEFVSLPA